MAHPLDGLRVVDLSRLLPGPICAHWLAQMGAEVIKIEQPGTGDYVRWFEPELLGANALFAMVNQHNRSVALNLRQPEGAETLLRLLEGADVLLESFRPGAMERLGLAPETLRERFPKLVLCSLTGYGRTGTMKQKAGHDLNYMAMAGFGSLNKGTGTAPHVSGLQIADVAGGGLFAVSGILAALLERERTGQGQHLDVAMTDGALALMAHHYGVAQALGRTPELHDTPLFGGMPGYRYYETADGRHLAVGAIEPQFFEAFMATIGKPDTPLDDQEALTAHIADRIAEKPLALWLEAFADVDACTTESVNLHETHEHPYHQARGNFVPLPAPEHGKEVLAVRFPVRFGDDAPRQPNLPPKLGEHTREVLAEAGLAPEEIDALAEKGGIG